MKILDVEQGTQEWLDARAGVATASQAKRLVTEKRLDPSKQIHAYALELALERHLGRPLESDLASPWMERGSGMEAEAFEWYRRNINDTARRVGFVVSNSGYIGCSPDGLTDDGGIEIKCPKALTHAAYLLDRDENGNLNAPSVYMPQMQFSMFVTGFLWWDFVSYCPGLPPVSVSVPRNEKWMDAFRGACAILIPAIEDAERRLGEESDRWREAQEAADQSWLDDVLGVPEGERD